MGRDFSKFSIVQSIYVIIKQVLNSPGGVMYMCWILWFQCCVHQIKDKYQTNEASKPNVGMIEVGGGEANSA